MFSLLSLVLYSGSSRWFSSTGCFSTGFFLRGIFFFLPLAQAQPKLSPVSASASFYQPRREEPSNLSPADGAMTCLDTCTTWLPLFPPYQGHLFSQHRHWGRKGGKIKHCKTPHYCIAPQGKNQFNFAPLVPQTWLWPLTHDGGEQGKVGSSFQVRNVTAMPGNKINLWI